MGSGLNTALLTILRGFVANRAGMVNPDAFVSIKRDGVGRQSNLSLSYPDYRDLRGAMVFTAAIASRHFRAPARLANDSRVVLMEFVSDDYFDALGVSPAVGRLIGAHEGGAQTNVVVISHRVWQSHFGGSGAVLGRTVRVRDREMTVVGVAPASFGGLYAPAVMPTEVWLPLDNAPQLAAARLEDRDALCVQVFGRIATGADPRQIRSALTVLADNLERAHPTPRPGRARTFEPTPLGNIWVHETIDPFVKRAAAGVGFISVLVLLLACTQLATMILARNLDRQGDLAVRRALGAPRHRVLQLLLTEDLLVALAAAIAASLVGWWSVKALAHITPPVLLGITVRATPVIDASVLALTLGLALTAAVVFGLWPALRASRPDALRLAGPDAAPEVPGGQLRGQHVLVAVQVAASSLLLVLAGSFARNYLRATAAELSADPAGLAVVGLELGAQDYDAAAATRLLQTASERALALPGVRSAAYGDYLPGDNILVQGGRWSWVHADRGSEEPVMVRVHRVGPGHLPAIGLRLLAGRDIDSGDRVGSLPVAVVGESLARRCWPTGSAIGRLLVPDDSRQPPLTVMGVVSDLHLDGINTRRVASVYVPFAQEPSTSAFVVARTGGNGNSLGLKLDRIVKTLDPTLTTTQATTLARVLRERRYPAEIGARIMTGLGLLALGLGCGGVYALAAYLVSRRRRELALRLALGATPAGLIALVLRQSLWLTAAGSGVGVALAALTAKVAGALFFDPGALDVAVCFGVPVGAVLVTVLACAGPAWAASRVDPVRGLRG